MDQVGVDQIGRETPDRVTQAPRHPGTDVGPRRDRLDVDAQRDQLAGKEVMVTRRQNQHPEV